MIKYLIKVIIRSILKIFWVLPVDPLKVCLQSFGGSRPSCNPLYIFKYLSAEHPEYKYVWLVNESPEEKLDNALYVKKFSLRWFYEIFTSRVIVTNNGFYSFIPLRKKNVVIETWHGGGAYKRVASGFDAKNKNTDEYKTLAYYAKHVTYYISSSKKFTQVMSESALVDEKKFLSIGMPRNDIFFNKHIVNSLNGKIREQFGVGLDDYVVLYAPTYRGAVRDSFFDSAMDVQKLRQAIIKKTGKKVIVLFRGHRFLQEQTLTQGVDMDVSSYPDMQELLCATDMLITDYSSSMWDFSFLNRPCFLFVPDFDDYYSSRGFYTDPKTWEFPICKSNEELAKKILSFDDVTCIKAAQKHHDNFVSYEKGTATKSIAGLIVEIVGKR